MQLKEDNNYPYPKATLTALAESPLCTNRHFYKMTSQITQVLKVLLIFGTLQLPGLAHAVAPHGSTLVITGELLGGLLKAPVSVSVNLERRAPALYELPVYLSSDTRPWVEDGSFRKYFTLTSRANGSDVYKLDVAGDWSASHNPGEAADLKVVDAKGEHVSQVTLGATSVLVQADAGADSVIVPNDTTPNDGIVNDITEGDIVLINEHLYRVGAMTPEGDTVVMALTPAVGNGGLAETALIGDLIAEQQRFDVVLSGQVSEANRADPDATVVANVTAGVLDEDGNFQDGLYEELTTVFKVGLDPFIINPPPLLRALFPDTVELSISGAELPI